MLQLQNGRERRGDLFVVDFEVGLDEVSKEKFTDIEILTLEFSGELIGDHN